MCTKEKIVQGCGPSNIYLGIFVCSFDVCGLHNHSPLLTMRQDNWKAEDWRTSRKISSTNHVQPGSYIRVYFTNWLCCLFYLDTTSLHPYEPVGCFQDLKYPRALPILVQTYSVEETNLANSLAAIIRACAAKVYERGFWYFGVEYRHECWSSLNSDVNYNRYGPSDNCLWNYNVGGEWSLFVYRFVEG